jgi:ribosomal protein S6--L-glutamate ligase/tetrahydromethanopterin:alpha-L-glutamate ligase
MKKTVLVIGDIIPQFKSHSSFRSFLDKEKYLYRKGIDLKVVEYYEVLNGHLPQIETKNITVVTFFPYHYWDENIEIEDKGDHIYGDETYGKKFNRLFNRVEKRLYSKYKDKKLFFINSPASIRIDRDKKKTKDILEKAGIPTPKLYRVKSHKDILEFVNRGESIYIKPRFGAMGKGISFISPGRWHTNFIFRGGKISSHKNDYSWNFSLVTGNVNFLKSLLRHDVICEQAIEHPVIDGRKIDFRVYVIFGEVPYVYAKSTRAKGVITNWSQGGTIEKPSFLKKFPRGVVERAKFLARKTAVALKLNYTGVDVVFSGDFDKAYVLEAHSFPGYEKGFDLMKYLVKKL